MMTSTTSLNLLAALHQGFFYPVQASNIAKDVDPLAWYIHGVTIFFTVGIIAVTIYFVIKYRASAHPIPEPPGHNNVLEVVWTVIPAIILFICFFWGFKVQMRMVVQQPGAERIEAVGFQWDWQFIYRNPKGGPNVMSNDLYLPLNKPVEITMRSTDVIHALFLPAMRVKRDVVPGRYNTMVFEPTRAGTYDLYCAEYCGDSHSLMRRKAHVLDRDAYAAKMEELSRPDLGPNGEVLPPEKVGENVAALNGCFSCHSRDGAAGTGPTWKDLYGATNHELADGSRITVDDNYIVDSIRNPNKQIRKGFGPPSAMNPYTPGQISDEFVRAIIEYQKSISQYAPKTTTPAPSGGMPPTTTPNNSNPPPAESVKSDGAKTNN